MSVFSLSAQTIFAPTNAAGQPRGANMGETQTWGVELERLVDAVVALGGKLYDSKATMDADLDHDPNTPALVLGDSAANDGLYRKSGASGSGSWIRVADVPGYSFVVASDAASGDENAIAATTALPVNGSQLITLPITTTTTASPVTVAFNGGSALTIKTASNNDVSSGGLVASSEIIGRISGSTFRMLSDQASSAIQAAAEAAAVAAQAAVDALDGFTMSLPSATAGFTFTNAAADSRVEVIAPGTFYPDTGRWQDLYARGSVTAPTRSGALYKTMLNDAGTQRRNASMILRDPNMAIQQDYCAPADVNSAKSGIDYVTVDTLNGEDAPMNGGAIRAINGDKSGLTTFVDNSITYGVANSHYTAGTETTTMPPGWVRHVGEPGNFRREQHNSPSNNRNPLGYLFGGYIVGAELDSGGPLPRGGFYGALKPEDHQTKLRNYRGLIGTVVGTVYCDPAHLIYGDLTTFDYVISNDDTTIASLRREDGNTTSITYNGTTYNVTDNIPTGWVAHRGNLEQRSCGATFNLVSGDMDLWTSPDSANPRGINLYTDTVQRIKLTSDGKFLKGATTGARDVEFHSTSSLGVRHVSTATRSGEEFEDANTTVRPNIQSLGNTLLLRANNLDQVEVKSAGIDFNDLTTIDDDLVITAGNGLTLGSGPELNGMFYGSASLDFPSIAAGDSEDLTITVTGAATGDVGHVNCDMGSSFLIPFVRSMTANTMNVRCANISGGAIDPGSRTAYYEARSYN